MATRTQPNPGVDSPSDPSATSPRKPDIGTDLLLALTDLQEDSLNPRKDFPVTGLEELADSIRTHGLLQPLLVRPIHGSRPDTLFKIVAGARRFRAAPLAGLTHVRCVVREDLTDQQTLAMMVTENLQRDGLNPLELAEAIESALSLGMKGVDVAQQFGLAPSTVSNHRRLLKLPVEMQDLVRSGRLAPSAAEALAAYLRSPECEPAVVFVAKEVAANPVSVRSIEKTLPYGDELVSADLAEILGYRANWEECQACPFGANVLSTNARYYGSLTDVRVCLHPTHLPIVAEARRQAEEARLEAQRQALPDAQTFPRGNESSVWTPPGHGIPPLHERIYEVEDTVTVSGPPPDPRSETRDARPETRDARPGSARPTIMATGHSDEFTTPPEALEVLLPYLPREWRIWECAPGNGSLVRALQAEGRDVVAEPRDFLTWEPSRWDCLVTNPPYSAKDEFLTQAYALGKPFAFLLPTAVFDSIDRRALFRKHGVQLLIPEGRTEFTTPSGKVGGAWFLALWVCHGLDLPREITFSGMAPAALPARLTPDAADALQRLTESHNRFDPANPLTAAQWLQAKLVSDADEQGLYEETPAHPGSPATLDDTAGADDTGPDEPVTEIRVSRSDLVYGKGDAKGELLLFVEEGRRGRIVVYGAECYLLTETRGEYATGHADEVTGWEVVPASQWRDETYDQGGYRTGRLHLDHLGRPWVLSARVRFVPEEPKQEKPDDAEL